MEKVKPIIKALLFGAIMLLFFICSSLIAKALKLSANRTYIFQGGMMLLSTIVPIFYIGCKEYGASDIGLNKINLKSLKGLLFYLPLIVALCMLIISFNKKVTAKSLIIQLFYYGSVAVAAEIYFRGLIQKEFRGKYNIILTIIIVGLLYSLTNLYYYGRLSYLKHILIFSMGSFALAGINCMMVEKKGNIVITGIFNALYLLIGINYIADGKRLLLGQGLCWLVLLIYGLFLLLTYLKPSKPKEEIEETKEEVVEDTSTLEEPNMTLE